MERVSFDLNLFDFKTDSRSGIIKLDIFNLLEHLNMNRNTDIILNHYNTHQISAHVKLPSSYSNFSTFAPSLSPEGEL